MPCGPRLDAPDTLHHVLGRGIEGRALFRDDRDRDDFLRRLGAVAGAKTLAMSAWALLPNHLHLLVQTGLQPLAAVAGFLGVTTSAVTRAARADPVPGLAKLLDP